MFASLPMSEEVVNELPLNPWVYGGLAFALFMTLLAITLTFGKGRPHA